jgi:hypothetical protein
MAIQYRSTAVEFPKRSVLAYTRFLHLTDSAGLLSFDTTE